MSSGRRAFTLIEILVVIVIIAIMITIVTGMLTGRTKSGEKGKSPIQGAQGAVCTSNLFNIRQSISIHKMGDENEANPQSLTELKLSAEVLYCADGKVAYQYDAATGQVRCPTPGHERY